jgi:xanthine dehydrogenase accessory factor
MSELQSILKLWSEARSQGEEICLATIVGVEGSSYRKPGARMLLTRGGRRAGTISGGCLEAEVQKKAWWLTSSGPSVEHYSSFYDEDSEMPYGLGCGGTVSVLLERGEAAASVLAALEQSLASREEIVFVAVTDSSSQVGVGTQLILLENGNILFESMASVEALALARQAFREKRSLWWGGLFIEYVPPLMGLLVVGAGDDAIPLVEFGGKLGWQTTVVDGRSHLATRERFPWAERVLAMRSVDGLSVTEHDAAVILTHSYAQDRAALRALLPQELGYLGILGPRRRTERLLAEVAPEIGLTVEECFARLHSPVGLKIGAKDPESIALAITAEIYSVMEGANRTARESIRSLRSIHG